MVDYRCDSSENKRNGEIRSLYRLVFGIQETPIEIELGMKQETVNEWQDLRGIQEVNRADQIDHLNSLRCKKQSAKFNLPHAKSEKISETTFMVCGRKLRR